jgi:hypothetical protein
MAVAVGIHFHDGEIAKFADACFAALSSGYRGITQVTRDKLTIDGKFREAERRKHEAIEKLERISCNLTEEQKGALDEAFQKYVSLFDSQCVERSLTRDYWHIQYGSFSNVSSGVGYVP